MNIDSIFEGLELSEDAVTQIKAIFNAAVSEQVEATTKELREHYEQKSNEYGEYVKAEYDAKVSKLEESHKEYISEMDVKADAYLSTVVKEWLSENEVAAVNQMKLSRLETFVDKVRQVFNESQIEFPETQMNALEELQAKLKESEEMNKSLTKTLQEMNESAKEQTKAKIFEGVVSGMTELQIERMKVLTGDTEYVNEEDYGVRLNAIKEAFIEKQSNTQNTAPAQTVNESAPEDNKPAKNSTGIQSSVLKALANRSFDL